MPSAQVVLERMRTRAHQATSGRPGGAGPVTFSAGAAESPAGEDIELALERADKAMYRAKREGRDRVACAAEPSRIQAEQRSGPAVGAGVS